MKKKAPGKLYKKYFIVIVSILLTCITVAGSLMFVLIYQSTKQERLTSMLNSAMEISNYASRRYEEMLLQVLLEIEEYKNANDTDEISDEDKNAIATAAMKTAVMEISDYVRLHSNIRDADFFVCNASNGKIICCKEMAENPEGETCLVHGSLSIDSDTRLKATDAKKRIYIGNLNGIYTERHFIAAYPVNVSDKITHYVFATQSLKTGMEPYTNRVLQILLFSCALTLLLALVVVYILTYSLTKPIKEISAATKRYAKGDFSYRVPVRGNDELSELTAAFNSMADSLTLTESSRRSFVANVSHELKTPMTTIGGFIDGILDGTISDKEQQNRYLGIVSEEVKRLSRLIVSMLNMSKIEAGELKLSRKKYSITEQIIHCLLTFEKSISDKGIKISGLDSMDNIMVNADEDMINQIIYNLLDNAVKFTPPGETISFNAFVEKNEAVVEIRNTGVEISADELRKVFERFYKVDKSRSLDTKGVGLGLYIVKSILDLHGGDISVSSGNGFVEFSFRIPLRAT